MTYKFYINEKPTEALEIKKQYGEQLLSTMIQAMGYRQKEKRDESHDARCKSNCGQIENSKNIEKPIV